MAVTGTTLRVYKCTFMSTSYLMPNGKPCIFVNGVYRTNNPAEIAEFDSMIANGHPHFFIDPNEREVDSGLVDPMEAMRHRIIEEYKASMVQAAGDPDRDMGKSDQTARLNVASTRNIEEAAAGGSGSSLAARLMKIAPPAGQNTGSISSATGQPILNVPVVGTGDEAGAGEKI